MSIINIDLSDTIAGWRTKNNQLANQVGDLTLLTDSAASIVAAINGLQTGIDSDIISLQNEIASVQGQITGGLDSDLNALRINIYGESDGTTLDLSYLNTTDKTSIVDAINELDRRLVDVYNSSGVLLNT